MAKGEEEEGADREGCADFHVRSTLRVGDCCVVCVCVVVCVLYCGVCVVLRWECVCVCLGMLRSSDEMRLGNSS